MGTPVWFLAAMLLAGAELAVGDLTLLMLAGGALAGAGATALGAPLWGALATFGVVSVGLVFFLRPVLRRKLASPPAMDLSPKALVGQRAEVLEPTGSSRGQVRLDGSVWSARSMVDDHEFQPGDVVRVVSIDGPVAIVWKEN